MFLGIYARRMFWFFINDLLYYVQLYKNLAFENEFNKSDVWYHVLINEVQEFWHEVGSRHKIHYNVTFNITPKLYSSFKNGR